MKKIVPQIILICCFITSMYASESIVSTTFNPDLSKENITKSTTDVRPKFRIGFDAPQINHRQLLLTIDENCTDGVDWGYDGETPQVLADDMYWLISDKKYVIQGTNTVFIGKEIPLGVITTNGGVITIKIDALENPMSDLKVGLKDTTLNITHKLEESDYQVTLAAGEYHNRFLIVFLSPNTSELPATEEPEESEEPEENVVPEDDASVLPPAPPGFTEETETEETESNEESTDTDINEDDEEETSEESSNDEEEDSTDSDEETTDIPNNTYTPQNHFNKNKLVIYVNNGQSILNVKNKRGLEIKRIALFNRNGQKVKVWNKNLDSDTIQLQLQVDRGIYLVMVQTNNDRIIKRVLIQNS